MSAYYHKRNEGTRLTPENRGRERQGPHAETARTRRLGVDAQRPPIRLHSDENPYGCSLNVQDALASTDLYHLPADPVCTDLRAALGEYTGFSPERIVAGAGTAELTERLLHAFLEQGDGVITCPPSLPQPSLGASRARVTVVQVPRTEK